MFNHGNSKVEIVGRNRRSKIEIRKSKIENRKSTDQFLKMRIAKALAASSSSGESVAMVTGDPHVNVRGCLSRSTKIIVLCQSPLSDDHHRKPRSPRS